jgi:glycerate dehydrogenase
MSTSGPLKIAFLDRATLDMGDIDFSPIEELGPFSSTNATDPRITGELSSHAGDAEALIVNKVPITGGALETLPNVGHVAVIATGVNNIDLEAAQERGVAVTNVAGYARYSVPQHVFALILSLAGRIRDYASDVDRGSWTTSPIFTLLRYPTFELAGKTIGIIGWGATAQATARIAEGFGMQVLVWNRRPVEAPPHRVVEFDELLAKSDVVSLHVPLAEETLGLIGKSQLERMKRTALLINVARGGIVDESALISALESGQIAGAGLDVLVDEPPRKSVIPPRLEKGDLNLVVTPHCAWSAVEARQRLVNEVAANLAAWRHGESRNRVV